MLTLNITFSNGDAFSFSGDHTHELEGILKAWYAQRAENQTDQQAKIDATANQLSAQSDRLSEAVTANTPPVTKD